MSAPDMEKRMDVEKAKEKVKVMDMATIQGVRIHIHTKIQRAIHS